MLVTMERAPISFLPLTRPIRHAQQFFIYTLEPIKITHNFTFIPSVTKMGPPPYLCDVIDECPLGNIY